MSKSKRCVRCRYYKTAHDSPVVPAACHRYEPPAPLWLRIRTKVVGWFL